ncbi:SLC13 family permease [Marinococcus luteus]|uniref:SLC13 family permease n=1 Tax=Marinococcus luteus TaxID=1122204 RepID=UPI002ACC75A1|nr:SLC13 family permease [Marinococcus luteus]MDZ5784244.1 SLC13 family permease [Marinococcus luteus]
MTIEMVFVMVLIAGMLLALFFELARPDMIVFSVLVVLMLTGILSTEQALSGFSNEGMLTIALLFIVAGAVQKSGIVERFMTRWLQKSHGPVSSMVRTFIPISGMSAFLNNTPIVVAFTPVIKKWCEERGYSPSKFLIPLSYATIMGGTITLIGTSTNLVVHGMLLDYGEKGFSMFQLASVGLPLTAVGLLYLFTVGYRLLPAYENVQKQLEEEAKEYLCEMKVEPSFPFIRKTVQDAGLRDLQGMFLIEIIRKDERISPVSSNTIVQAGDRLIFTGVIEKMADLQRSPGLTLKTGTDLSLDDLRDNTNQLVEAVVSHQSSLQSKSIKQAQFRSAYDAGVVAVHRNNERIQSKIGDIRLRPGDSLLLLAGSDFLQKYRSSTDFYVVSALNTPDTIKEPPAKGWFSLAVLMVMIAVVTIGWLSMFQAMALAVLIFLVARIITPEEAKRNVQFQVLLLIASAFGVGNAMTETGLAAWMAGGLLTFGEPLGIIAVLFLIYALTNIFTELITNSAAAVLMLPIGLSIADSLNVEPMAFAVTIAIAASASFITPIGYQTNLIVYGPGGYKFSDYLKVGMPLTLISMLVTVGVVSYLYF